MATQSGKPRYYSLLGIPPDATAVDVRKAYRQMARLKHPDKHGNSAVATAEFQQLQQAYEILSDPKARDDYDQAITGELANSTQRRARYAEIFGHVLQDSSRMQNSVNYKVRLVEALELRLRQKKRAYEAEQRRILEAQAVITISDDDSPEPTQPFRSNTKHGFTALTSEAEVIGEIPPQTVQEYTLAKRDHQKAAADMQDAESALKRVKDEMNVIQEKLRRSENECAELEREHSPRSRGEAARIPGQGSFQQPFESGPRATFRGHPSHHEATQNVSPTPKPRGPYQAPQEQHYQHPRSHSIHGGMPPPQWAYQPPPQQPWPPQNVRPEANAFRSQYEKMQADIERLNARELDNARYMESLIQKNLALANEVQRLKQMLDQTTQQQAGSNDGADSAIRKKRGRPRGSGRNSDDTGERGPKSARRV